MTTETRKIESYEELEAISRTGSKMAGRYEVRCLGMVMGRYANLDYALAQANKLQAQVDAEVTIH